MEERAVQMESEAPRLENLLEVRLWASIGEDRGLRCLLCCVVLRLATLPLHAIAHRGPQLDTAGPVLGQETRRQECARAGDAKAH